MRLTFGPVVEAEVHAVDRSLRPASETSGTAFETTWSAVASQPLSTDERIGVSIGSPVGGQTVSFSPVVWSYQL